jgi:uncharacterized membrane protein
MCRSVAHIAAALGLLVLASSAAPATPAGLAELPTAFECSGNEPFWNLTIRQDTAEFSSLASTLGPEISALRGSYGSLSRVAEPLFVWRGRAQGTPREVVVFITQTRCVDTMSDREGQTAFPYSARVSLPNDQLLAGCCRAGAAAAGSRVAAAAERLPAADLQSKPTDDWSRLLIELLAPIKACLARAPGTVTRVTKAWPMNKAMTGVRIRDDAAGYWECVAEAQGAAVHLFEPLPTGTARLPGEDRVLFTPAAQAPPSGRCYKHERVLFPEGELLGWLSYDGC